MFSAIPEGTLCANGHCGHKATVNFYPDITAVMQMGAFHLSPEQWCECCVITKDLDYIRKQAERIPELTFQLQAACRDEN